MRWNSNQGSGKLRNRFSRAMRLQHDDFKRIFNKSKKIKDDRFMILTEPNGLSYARLGVVIPKKVVNKSTKRNRIRRLFRENFRQNQHRMIGMDAIVIMCRSFNQSGGKLLPKEIALLWQNLCTLQSICVK